ncbi:hypothetical protein DH2020_025520 [Rehmannia glutinosa]|uniref:Pectinesterase inhibitor domain-containing protein n=1 Tax=Rehmannia glutinosa TaxID=99300 RepID=A0ABR0VZH6_REHGL
MRDAYRKCLKDYTDAMNELTKAEKSMADAKIKPVREYALNALNKVRSCDQELAKQWHEASGLTHDNRKFYDLSSILMVICDRNARITDEIIKDICSKTRNPNLCLNNLDSLRGTRLFPKPLVVLATNPISIAQSHSNRTATMIWDHYRGTPAPKIELKKRYKRCVQKYGDAMKQLNKAKKLMAAGEAISVKTHTLMAVDRVDSCDVELIKPPSTKLQANREFLQANREFKDICDIIVEICNKLSS